LTGRGTLKPPFVRSLTDAEEPGSSLSPQLMRDGRELAATLPDLLIEARRVALTVAAGWHGRRQSGPGETFWQYRPFITGESIAGIDWRRSARDDHLYIREQEWESAHTVWLWPDLSPSMAFRSSLSNVTKRDRALVLTLALADLLSRGGERVGMPGVLRPAANRDAAERLGAALMHVRPDGALPGDTPLGRFSDIVVFADLLDPLDEIEAFVRHAADAGTRGHLIQILDPVEETFPFTGRSEFRDPESGLRVLAGRAEEWRAAYGERLKARREALQRLVGRIGWSMILHHTDRPAAEPLLSLHRRLTDGGNDAAARASGNGGGRR